MTSYKEPWEQLGQHLNPEVRNPVFSRIKEHTNGISQLIREAKKNKDNPTVVWLDLANGIRPIQSDWGNLESIVV